jgi:hypothetical protein
MGTTTRIGGITGGVFGLLYGGGGGLEGSTKRGP